MAVQVGRLFWKFFLVFWLTVITAGLGVGAVVWLHKYAGQERDPYVAAGGPAAFITRTGATVLETAGVDALRTVLYEWREPFPLYVVDANGHELLDRAVEAPAVDAARRIAASADARRGARNVTLADGDSYLLFVPARAVRAPEPPPAAGPPPADDVPPGPPHRRPAPWLPIGAGLLASLAFSALLAWYMAKPIRHLRRAFEAAAAGNLDVRVQPLIGRRRDEIADLGREYDRMAGRLKELIDAQRRLFQDVSHELRSPLARLQAAVGLIRQGGGDTEAALERVEREAGRLDDLVGELLLLARLESGVPGAMDGDVDLIDLIDGIIEDARFEAEARGCHVQFQGGGPISVTGRADLLGRAIENVIRNAIRHTAPDTTVGVEVRSDAAANLLTLSVCDRGPGIAPEAREAMFEPFYRVPGSEHFRGYGLGLAIARRAVEAHGGSIRAGNRAGGGLRVDIHLPLTRSAVRD